ncbi:hypothetical protein PVAG01_10148 [Phlyctema vagabunda]|uniref:Uncharacterized protein n=1 Tax=Phlyctema vagabunda TaxID=108571 RepID=A0ABR4P5I3_9HELO
MKAAITILNAASAFAFSKREIEKQIPVVTKIPGTYAIERTERKKPFKVVSVRKALSLALNKQSKTQRQEESPTKIREKEKGLLRHYNDPIRFMVSTPEIAVRKQESGVEGAS